ncbi:MAG TPA: response regulator [candidate division Zixibacteria bacterium]|nr:response regulator [candidate division Zixibacteria bacterium]
MPEQFEDNSNILFPRAMAPKRAPKQAILLVEDEEYVREVAREILELEGYHVIEASHPHEALERYEQHGGKIDLLVTDVVMPGMDGHDLAERLTQKQPSIKLMFMSGYTENALLKRGIRDMNAAYLQKPFTLQALLEKVREVIADANSTWIAGSDEALTEPSDAAL